MRAFDRLLYSVKAPPTRCNPNQCAYVWYIIFCPHRWLTRDAQKVLGELRMQPAQLEYNCAMEPASDGLRCLARRLKQCLADSRSSAWYGPYRPTAESARSATSPGHIGLRIQKKYERGDDTRLFVAAGRAFDRAGSHFVSRRTLGRVPVRRDLANQHRKQALAAVAHLFEFCAAAR